MANLNINKVILGGRIVQDLELKQTPQGVSVTTFSIAVNRRGKDAQTDFINCQAWRQAAETICKYFKKGSSICVIGSIQTRSWTDQQNNKRTATEVVADEVYFVDSKADNQASIPTEPIFQQQAPKFEEIDADDTLPF